jgi:hypothetical protein
VPKTKVLSLRMVICFQRAMLRSINRSWFGSWFGSNNPMYISAEIRPDVVARSFGCGLIASDTLIGLRSLIDRGQSLAPSRVFFRTVTFCSSIWAYIISHKVRYFQMNLSIRVGMKIAMFT